MKYMDSHTGFIGNLSGLVSVAVLAAAVMAGCNTELQENTGNEVSVRFELCGTVGIASRSSLAFDEGSLSDINIYVYEEGRLYEDYYTEDIGSGIEMRLSVNRDYSIYALANTGRLPAPEDETGLRSLVLDIGNLADLAGTGMPMAAEEHVRVDPMLDVIRLVLVRLVSKVGFSIESDELHGYTVNSIRLMQVPDDIAPFSGPSAASSVSDGDYATVEDLERINSGGEVYFYMLENCQGILLPDNRDQWRKVPDNIPDKAGLCTYIEVNATFDGSGGLSGEVIYRFYLGQDNTSDFNVYRNTESSVTLSLTEGGLSEVSWRIDTSGLEAGDIEYIVDAPDYCGQWGKVIFPDATESSPVIVTYRGASLQIPSSSPAHLGDVSEDAPNLLVYVPQDENALYVCFGTTNRSYSSFSVRSGVREQTVSFDIGPYLVWAVCVDELGSDVLPAGSTIRVNEDGHDFECWFYLRDQEADRTVYPSEFTMPEYVRKYLDRHRSCPDPNSHIYWYYDLDAWVEDQDVADISMDWSVRPALEDAGESYLFVGYLYGLAAADAASARTGMRCNQNYLSGSTTYRIEVGPAFPDQKHFGMVYNYQMALGDLESDRAVLDIGGGASSDAVWKIAKGSRYAAGDQYRDESLVMDLGDRSLISIRKASDEMTIMFREPERFDDLNYLAGGTYHIRGSVTNPHTGREIHGDYSVDVILYLVFGVDVYFYRGQSHGLPAGTYMDFSYVPVLDRYGQTDDEAYHDFWSVYPVCDIYNNTAGRKFAPGVPFLSGRSAEAFNLPDLDNLDAGFGIISSGLRSYLSEAGREFRFVDPDDGSLHDELLYYDEAEPYALFYELHRLQDIDPGTYFIEDYYGSFDNY